MRPPYDEIQELNGTETDSQLALLHFKKSWPRTYRIAGLIVSIWLRLWRPVPTFKWLWEIGSSQMARRRQDRLTVGVDIASLWEPLTGVGWYLFRLLENLAHNDEVRLRLYGPSIVESSDLPGPVVDLPTGPALERVSLPVPDNLILPPGLMSKILRKAEPLLIAADKNDVLFAPNFFLPRRFDLAGGARVVTVHDLGLRQVPWTMRSETLRELGAKLEHSCFEAARLITDTRAVRDELVAYGYARPERIRAIHLGPGQVANVEPTELPAGAPSHFGLHVGTLEPRKNIVGLLAAWRLVRQQLAEPPALVLSGRFGWKSREIQREIRLAEREGWLQHLGYVTEDELATLYREAALVVLPSLYEGFGLPAIEAMFADTPLVCSDIEVLREVAGDAALYAPADRPDLLAERVIELLTDPALAKSLVRKGGERRGHFSWQQASSQTLEVWVEAAGMGLERQPGELLAEPTLEGGRI
ncbi:MAG: glycosyltransferase family 1 protein [Thermoanaerobaculia bacterium]